VVDILIFTVTELQGLAALGVPVNLAHAIAATLQMNTGGLQQAAGHQLLLKKAINDKVQGSVVGLLVTDLRKVYC